MGLQLPKRARRFGLRAAAAAGLLLVTGCSAETVDEAQRFAMPEPATDRAEAINDLWQGSWIAALIVGIAVWGLILYVSFRYRRRRDDEIPVQVRYNLPIEILYTVTPIIIVLVLFFYTVQTQNEVLAAPAEGESEHTINVTGQQWSWTFSYVDEEAVDGEPVYTVGTPSEFPTLVLPVNESVDINLYSPDVIHSFWVPAFLFKLDIIPGLTNSFSFTPNREGTFAGKCTEFCGVYHPRMLFNVEVVSPEEYDQHLRDLRAAGNVGLPRGGVDAEEPAGFDDEAEPSQPREDVLEDETTDSGDAQ